MLSSGEVVEIMESYIDDKRELILTINELIDAIQHNPKGFCYDLSQECEDIADGEGICPLCANNLEYNTYSEDREYFGQPTSEFITVAQCSNSDCSYVTED